MEVVAISDPPAAVDVRNGRNDRRGKGKPQGKKAAAMEAIRQFGNEAKKSEIFERYYQEQLGIVPPEEWSQFMEALKSDLPTTFRLCGFREQSLELLHLFKNKYLEQLLQLPADGDATQSFKPPYPMVWYPQEMAWQIDASKTQIRRNTSLKRLHEFLISETESGYISRQEAVSMIPPLLLDIQSHHTVLDLCAAPGSKTAQLVELMHADAAAQAETAPKIGSGSVVPSGLVIANDREQKRCYMMVHQLQRLQSPCVVVTRHDATSYPRLYIKEETDNISEGPNTGEKQLLFDRVLADVPCSGDGTLRKSPDLWPRWSPSLALAEHFVQCKILRRGLELLAVGGRLVYSTCSMNPLEDEAVVAAVLHECQGSVEIIDESHRVPGLRWQPGISKWGVMLKDGTWCQSHEDVPSVHLRCVRRSLFPPENCEQLNLNRCMRILPHHQNTGGFFIAVLHKVAHLPWMSETRLKFVPLPTKEIVKSSPCGSPNAPDAKRSRVETEASEPPKEEPIVESAKQSKRGNKGPRVYREDPFNFLADDANECDIEWRRTSEFYCVDAKFPSNQLMFRRANDDQQKRRRNFYFTNKLLRNLVLCNHERGVIFVNLGVRLFGISEDQHFKGYRLLQEGVLIAYSYIGQTRRLSISSREDLLTILSYDMPLLTQMTSPDTLKAWKSTSVGPILMEYEPTSEDSYPRVKLLLTGWRGHASLRHYLDKHEREHMLRLCGLDEIPKVMEAPRRNAEETS